MFNTAAIHIALEKKKVSSTYFHHCSYGLLFKPTDQEQHPTDQINILSSFWKKKKQQQNINQCFNVEMPCAHTHTSIEAVRSRDRTLEGREGDGGEGRGLGSEA